MGAEMMSEPVFKPGDKVRFIYNPHPSTPRDCITGDIYTIKAYLGTSEPYVTLVENDDQWYAKRFELITSAPSPVFSPNHYNSGSLECIDAIEASMSRDEFLGYLKGNTMKYLWRYRYKGKPEEDLKKAQWYQEKLTTTYAKETND